MTAHPRSGDIVAAIRRHTGDHVRTDTIEQLLDGLDLTPLLNDEGQVNDTAVASLAERWFPTTPAAKPRTTFGKAGHEEARRRFGDAAVIARGQGSTDAPKKTGKAAGLEEARRRFGDDRTTMPSGRP